MGEKEECGGSEKNKGRLESVDACAQACKGVSSMFALGTNDFGVNRCNSKGCKCLCETSAADDGLLLWKAWAVKHIMECHCWNAYGVNHTSYCV